MLQIRTHTDALPERLRSEKMHGIVSRNTLFGYHRQFNTTRTKLIDKDCTKSTLWITPNEGIAQYMVQRLKEDFAKGLRFHHLDENLFLQRERVSSLMPLSIETFDMEDLEKICSLHHFDLYIADALNMTDDIHVMNGYEYVTRDFPQRAVLEKYMHDMLYKKNY
jgi:hypothetical protein